MEADVVVEDVGDGPAALRVDVDAACRAEYGRHGRSTVETMVGDAAAATTLRRLRRPSPEGDQRGARRTTQRRG